MIAAAVLGCGGRAESASNCSPVAALDSPCQSRLCRQLLPNQPFAPTPYYVLDLSNSLQKAYYKIKTPVGQVWEYLVSDLSKDPLLFSSVPTFLQIFHKPCVLFRLIRRPRVDQEWTESVFYCRSPHSQRDIFTNKLKINSRYCSYLDGYNLSRNEQRNNQKIKKSKRSIVANFFLEKQLPC